MNPFTFDEIGFAADVEAIKAEQRAKQQRAFDRAAFWERALDGLEDHDNALGDRRANQR